MLLLQSQLVRLAVTTRAPGSGLPGGRRCGFACTITADYEGEGSSVASAAAWPLMLSKACYSWLLPDAGAVDTERQMLVQFMLIDRALHEHPHLLLLLLMFLPLQACHRSAHL